MRGKMELEDWLPQLPWQGPPIPRFLGGWWEWLPKPAFGEIATITGLSKLPIEVQRAYMKSFVELHGEKEAKRLFGEELYNKLIS